MSTSTDQKPSTSTALNAKQQSRIQKRRLARQKLNDRLSINKELRKMHGQPLLYPASAKPNNSCGQYPRGPDGRSLTLDQIVARDMDTLAIREAGGEAVLREEAKI